MSSSTPDTPAPTAYALLPAASPVEESGMGLKGLVRILQRRRRIFLATTVAVTLVAGLWTAYRRINSPVFLGSFSLLISDPISESGAASSEAATGAIASVARNVTSNDVPTLISVLESPTVLEPVFTDLQRRYPDRKFPEMKVSLLEPDPTKRNSVVASGVLVVEARGSSPEFVNETLKLTKEAYLSWALQQRREKLKEGVKFLDEQAPELQARSSELQGELERFRTRKTCWPLRRRQPPCAARLSSCAVLSRTSWRSAAGCSRCAPMWRPAGSQPAHSPAPPAMAAAPEPNQPAPARA
ncbi:hypothetical protein [Synechococcus sp. CBW1107]|uniref:hypothetical protein n=1 Tax=Synechococcus sp. CBW1107 TaxID=2789857 RepID=UPI002AD2124B|nr:hypothetical protein [Synechococcus sp. CBW1107]